MKINNPHRIYKDKNWVLNFNKIWKSLEKDTKTIPFPYPLPKPTKIKL